ncbi:MAG: single-stranded DNA-binding protein [Clostridiales bacterium]|nr:single-stranded DNA-binding protein [Clostridiales bacterium]MBQ1575132.1 single-stranded DNA-binding protein [Clostridiales bacterium]
MLNKTTFQGRFTAKPEVQDKGGFSLCEFTIAWSDKYKDREDKCFLRCKAWRGMADFVGKYFDKGQECVVEGKLITEQWEADGKKQSRTICNVDKVHFCGSKASNKAEETPAGEEEFMKIPEDAKEELPFS